MGSAWMSPAQQTGFAQNFTPQQNLAFSNYISKGPAGQSSVYDIYSQPAFQQALQTSQSLMKPFDIGQMEQFFQQGVADPAMRFYEQRVLPSIKSQYLGPSTGASSALNKALARSGEELASGLGSVRANYLQQGQQQTAQNQLQSIAQSLGLVQAPAAQQQSYYNTLFGTQAIDPIVQQATSGPLRDILMGLLAAGGQAAGAAAKGGMF